MKQKKNEENVVEELLDFDLEKLFQGEIGPNVAGISQVTAKTVDFGASDAPLNATERSRAPGLLHIPETIGAVTAAYNLPGIPSGLNLTGQVLGDIFLGTITNWNDANITSLN